MLYKEIEKDVYLINLRGEIGVIINGFDTAETIEQLNAQGAKRIIEPINSNGGFIDHGMTIVNANLTSNATIETINTGAAGSIAALILASGDVRKAYDNSYAVIHDPQIAGETIENIKDENLKNNMLKVKETIVKTLVDACKKPKDFISKLMTRETAFTANEQKEFGLVDKVIKSRVKPPKTRNLAELMNYFDKNPQVTDKKPNNVNFRNMDLITNYLNLNKDASEKSILQAIKDMQKKSTNQIEGFEALKNEVSNLKTDLSEKENDLKAANDKLKAFHDQAIKNAVDSAINSGKFDESQRESLTDKAAKDLDFFNEMVNEMPVMHQSALQQIKNSQKTGEKQAAQGENVKDWDYYQKNDPEYLKQLEITNNAEYIKLFENYWGEPYQTAKN